MHDVFFGKFTQIDNVNSNNARRKSHLQEERVDPVDDLEMPGQEIAEQIHRPALQSLGQHSVVGVGASLHCELTGLNGRLCTL